MITDALRKRLFLNVDSIISHWQLLPYFWIRTGSIPTFSTAFATRKIVRYPQTKKGSGTGQNLLIKFQSLWTESSVFLLVCQLSNYLRRVRIFKAAYSGQKFKNPVMMKITATALRMVNSVPPTMPVYQSATMTNATIIRMMPSVLLIFLIMINACFK